MKRIVNAGKLNWGKRAYAVCVLCAATAMGVTGQTFTTLQGFDITDGAAPYARLVQATDGNFYGTTYEGGANDRGTIFKINPNGTVTTLHSFCSRSGCPDGEHPEAGLVQATDGDFYGATAAGGPNRAGTVFKITASGRLTTLHTFCLQSGCPDGAYPRARLVQSADGGFYGTTKYGGIKCSQQGCGTVFKISPGGMLTTLYRFCAQSECTDGANPFAELVQAAAGNFYGTTFAGGTGNLGTVFKVTPSGALTTLYSFCSQSGCLDGQDPYAGLAQDANGDLYGTTQYGGAHAGGTVFRIAPSGTLTTLYSFCSQSGCADGYYPYGDLFRATDGDFYGTTKGGGANGNYGTAFKITRSGTLTTLYGFCLQSGCADGAYPYAGLVQATDGDFYGTTFGGGASGYGTVFSLSVGLGPFVETQVVTRNLRER